MDLFVVAALILVALGFDFINGFHDAANSIATVVSTRVLSPGQGRHLVGLLQLRRRVPVRHRRRDDHRQRDDRADDAVAGQRGGRRHLRGHLRRAVRRDRLGPDHLVLRPADQFVARADRRLRGRGRRAGGPRRDHPVRLDEDPALHRAVAGDRDGGRPDADGRRSTGCCGGCRRRASTSGSASCSWCRPGSSA